MSLSTSSAIKITKENENRFREEVVDIFRVQKDAKRLFLCKERREIGSLETKLGDLERDRELKIQRYNKDQRNLQWYLYDLRLETSALKGKRFWCLSIIISRTGETKTPEASDLYTTADAKFV